MPEKLIMLGLEPGTFRLSMLSECAYHLRYIPADPSAHTHSILGRRTYSARYLQYEIGNFYCKIWVHKISLSRFN